MKEIHVTYLRKTTISLFIRREIITAGTAYKADVFALGITVIELV